MASSNEEMFTISWTYKFTTVRRHASWEWDIGQRVASRALMSRVVGRDGGRSGGEEWGEVGFGVGVWGQGGVGGQGGRWVRCRG